MAARKPVNKPAVKNGNVPQRSLMPSPKKGLLGPVPVEPVFTSSSIRVSGISSVAYVNSRINASYLDQLTLNKTARDQKSLLGPPPPYPPVRLPLNMDVRGPFPAPSVRLNKESQRLVLSRSEGEIREAARHLSTQAKLSFPLSHHGDGLLGPYPGYYDVGRYPAFGPSDKPGLLGPPPLPVVPQQMAVWMPAPPVPMGQKR